jgi:dienelactone hydrolase
MARIGRGTALALATLLVAAAPGPSGAPEGPLRRQPWQVPLAEGPDAPVAEAAVYRPEGNGPFPLLVLLPGAAPVDEAPPAFPAVVGWFLAQGWAVAVLPARPADCLGRPAAETIARLGRDLPAILRHLMAQDFVEPGRTVLLGHADGALGALALAAAPPEGLRALIGVAGGLPGCGLAPGAVAEAMGRLGASSRLPLLWLAFRNDSLVPPEQARAMFDAWQSRAAPPARLRLMPPHPIEGHRGLAEGRPYPWANHIREFLREAAPGSG